MHRNFKLLSFGEEAQEDEEETAIINKQFSSKSKSAHDNLVDPKLSAVLAIEPAGLPDKKPTEDDSLVDSDGVELTEEEQTRAKKEAA